MICSHAYSNLSLFQFVGAFLLVWFLMMWVLGFPLLFLYLSLGYFSGKNVIELWEAVPFFKGINNYNNNKTNILEKEETL